MADAKKSGRKSPVDRSNNDPGYPSSQVKNVKSGEQLSTGEQRARVGKSSKKSY